MMNGEAIQSAIQDRRSGIAFFGGASVADVLLRVLGKAVVIQRNCKFLSFWMADHVNALLWGIANFRQSRAERQLARAWRCDDAQDRYIHLDALRAIDEFAQLHSRAAVEPGKFDFGLRRTQWSLIHRVQTDDVGIGQEKRIVSPARTEVRARHQKT